MTGSEQVRALLKRVEEATGPDSALDDALLELIRSPSLSLKQITEAGERGETVLSGVIWWNHGSPTASVDSALALVERVLPGWSYMLDTRPVKAADYPEWRGNVRVRLYGPGLVAASFEVSAMAGHHSEAFGATPPLAVLCALLRAKLAQSETAEPKLMAPM